MKAEEFLLYFASISDLAMRIRNVKRGSILRAVFGKDGLRAIASLLGSGEAKGEGKGRGYEGKGKGEAGSLPAFGVLCVFGLFGFCASRTPRAELVWGILRRRVPDDEADRVCKARSEAEARSASGGFSLAKARAA